MPKSTNTYNPEAQADLITKATQKQYESKRDADLKSIQRKKEAEEKVLKELYELELRQLGDSQEAKEKASKKYLESLKQLYSEYDKEREKIDNTYKKEQLKSDKLNLEILKRYEANIFKYGSSKEKSDVRKAQIERIKAFKAEYDFKRQEAEKLMEAERELQDRLHSTDDSEEYDRLKQQLQQVQDKKIETDTYLQDPDNESQRGSADQDIVNTLKEGIEDLKATKDTEGLKSTAESLKSFALTSDLNEEEKKEAFKEAVKAEQDASAVELELSKEAAKLEKAALWELNGGLTGAIKSGLAEIGKGMTQVLAKHFDDIEGEINSFYEYQAKYQARMEGSQNEYKKILGNIGYAIGLSPFVKQSKMVENLQTLIDTGTNYNLELRAYIATVSENIASTFNAFDSQLLRLIRLQQNDSTAARLGMEAALTRMLNQMYEDSSYLTDVSDDVTHALLDAAAQLSHQGAAEMEFVAQKWLGALYSLGMSSDSITKIATGLGYIGSGNLSALTNDEAIFNLFTMGASEIGESISSILTTNLTAETTNSLLAGTVQYLAKIANNTDYNNITKSSLSEVFGVSNTDLVAISNLTSKDIATIQSATLNYSQALQEAQTQVEQISTRTHISTLVSNLVDNALTSSSLMIGSNAATYSMYKALNLVGKLVDSGLEIPGITALGTGTTSGIRPIDIAKAAFSGTSLLASLVGSLGNLNSGFLPELSDWKGWEESVSRGSGFEFNYDGVQEGYSQNVVYDNVSNVSEDDFITDSMKQANEKARSNQSQEDIAAADDAKAYYKEGRQYFANMLSAINNLQIESNLQSLRVTVSNEATSPIPVSVNYPEGSILKTELSHINSDTQVLLTRLLKNGIQNGLQGTDQLNSLDTEEDTTSINILDILTSRLNGLQVEVINDMSNPVQARLDYVGGI